ncbi:MAG: SURF1 family protein [Methylomonas sp.]
MKIVIAGREFTFSVLGLSVYLLMMTLLCNLGFWQLGRAEQKRQFLQQQQEASESAALDLNLNPVDDVESVRYRKAVVTGRYDDAHQFLVDNQMLDGRPGYYVLTPFIIANETRAVLVNRGWVPAGTDRQRLPVLNIRDSAARVSGRINHFPVVGIRLKGAEIPSSGWPAVVQVVDARVLAARLGYELHDFQIELDADAEEGYRREWKTVTVIPPEKHLAYAVQWFALALTLTGLFIWISSRKRSEHTA